MRFCFQQVTMEIFNMNVCMWVEKYMQVVKKYIKKECSFNTTPAVSVTASAIVYRSG